ncbi:MAG: HAD-IA family hydrolase [Candidatus Moranbacteria bacterium]|nr:HAD-IA family hydrolase [Candidatus Moranbacteria bacterium]
MKNKYKLAIFDMGRVLVGFDFAEFAKNLSIYSSLTPEEIKRELWTGEALGKLHNGEFGIEGFFEQFAADINLKGLELADFKEQFLSIFFENPGIEDVLDSLPKDFGRMILSDVGQFHWDNFFCKHPLIKSYFPEDRQKVLSFREGVSKPNPEIFKIALGRAGVKAEEAVFVDDKPENVEAFKALGGEGVQYDCTKEPAAELKQKLKQSGILIS